MKWSSKVLSQAKTLKFKLFLKGSNQEGRVQEQTSLSPKESSRIIKGEPYPYRMSMLSLPLSLSHATFFLSHSLPLSSISLFLVSVDQDDLRDDEFRTVNAPLT